MASLISVNFFIIKKLLFFLLVIFLFSCSKTPNQQINTLEITSISPINNGSIKQNVETEFKWSLFATDTNSPIYSKIKVVEILGDQSPEGAIRGNKPFFEKDSLIAVTLLIKPLVGTPGFVLDKKYVWQVTSKQKTINANGSLSVFTVVR